MGKLTVYAGLLMMAIGQTGIVNGMTTEELIFEKSPYVEAAQAITEGDTASLGKLINQGLDVNYTGKETRTPWGKDSVTLLLWATISENTKCVDLLLSRGADPNLPTRRGMTALIMAAGMKSTELFELLLVKYKANPNKIYGGTMKTALMVALREAQWERAALLIKNSADVNLDIGDGDTALTSFGRLGDWRIVYWLLENGADFNQRDSVKATVTCSVRRSYRVSPQISNAEIHAYRDKVRDWLLAHGVARSRVDPALHPDTKCDD